MEVVDLGPFCGKYSIDFGASEDEIATFVVGGNGLGKTFIARALCWIAGLKSSFTENLDRPESINFDAQENGAVTFSVRAEFQATGGSISRCREGGLSMQTSVVERELIRLVDGESLYMYEDSYRSHGGKRGSSSVSLYGLKKLVSAWCGETEILPLLIHDVFGRYDLEYWNRGMDVLAAYPGQVILIGNGWVPEHLDIAAPMRILNL